MTNQTQTPKTAEQEAFIPPYYMLILALAGFAVALIVLVTQPSFTVVGWGALGIAALSLVAWGLMAPDQARAVITGRTARFGGTSLVISAIFIVALVMIYIFVRGQDWSADLTERSEFTLTESSRQAIAALGADPTLPSVRMVAFYDAGLAGLRDQHTQLFEDYARTSAGKVSFEFVNPERNPALIDAYQAALTDPAEDAQPVEINAGQIAIVPLDEQGELNIPNAEVVSPYAFDPFTQRQQFSQETLTNTILRVIAVASAGDFRAHFLTVAGGLDLTDTSAAGVSRLNESLTGRFGWKTQQVPLFQLTQAGSEMPLNDPAANGEVVVIVGGDAPLTDDEVKVITDYLDGGGSLILFASPGISVTEGEQPGFAAGESLALTPALADYLFATFGLRFSEQIVVDPSQTLFGTLQQLIATEFDAASYITAGLQSGQFGVAFELPHNIEIAPALPQGVTVAELMKTSDQSFAKANIADILNAEDGNIQKAETDPAGPFVVAASAENATTGARVVLFGSSAVPANAFALPSNSGLVNLQTVFSSLVWTTRFNDFFTPPANVEPIARPQDQPVFATDQVLRNVLLFTVFLLPFGVLAIGLVVWWNNRERARVR